MIKIYCDAIKYGVRRRSSSRISVAEACASRCPLLFFRSLACHPTTIAASPAITPVVARGFSSKSSRSQKPPEQTIKNINDNDKRMLERAVSEAVRKYLSTHYEDAFSWDSSSSVSWVDLWKYPSSSSSKALETLASLNGFEKISTNEILHKDNFVSLAEGVIVKPCLRDHNASERRRILKAILAATRSKEDYSKLRDKYYEEREPMVLWSRPIVSAAKNIENDANSGDDDSSKDALSVNFERLSNITGNDGGKDDLARYPPMVEKDTTLYRIIEARVDQYIQWRVITYRNWFLRTRAAKALQYLGVIRSDNSSSDSNDDDNVEQTADTKALPQDRSGIEDLVDYNEGYVHSDVTAKREEDTEREEQLLLMDLADKTLAWYTHILPSHRLLAIDHTYQHKVASTAIHISFVVFGAVPLAYRSFVFAWDYPGLSEIIASSVIGTVLYGIYSSRSITEIRQAQIVSKGISQRIIARDHVAIWTLQQNAIQRLTDLILTVYYDHYDNQEHDGPKAGTNSGIRGNDDKQNAVTKGTLVPSPSSGASLDPLDIAIELELISRKKDFTYDNETSSERKVEYVSVPLKDALARLQ